MTKDIITSVIILLFLIAFALWSIARNIKESIVDVTFAIEKMSAEIRRTRESIDGLRKETAKLRIQAMKDKPDDHKVAEIADDLMEEIRRSMGDSYIVTAGGERHTVDSGYAMDGIEIFVRELKKRLEEDD